MTAHLGVHYGGWLAPLPTDRSIRYRNDVPRAPRVTGVEAVRALRRAGWDVDRTRGSHRILVHPERPGATVTVPIHTGEVLKPKTLSSILDQAGLSVEAFIDLL